MKKIVLSVLAVFLVYFGLALVPKPALAGPLDAKSDVWADVYWDTLSITFGSGISMASLLSPSDSYSEAVAENSNGEFENNIVDVPGWVDTSATATASTPYSVSDASIVGDLISTTAYSSMINGDSSGWTWAASEAWRDGTFVVAGSGDVTIEVDYQLEIDLSAGSSNQVVYGYSEAWLYMANENDLFNGDFAGDWQGNGFFGIDSFLYNTSGTLSLTMSFSDGDTVYFDTGTYTESDVEVVPEPSCIFLVGLGLLAIIGLKVRFRNKLAFLINLVK